MLKQTVQYTDFNDTPNTETLYFNLSKTEIADNLHLIDEVESLQAMMEEKGASPEALKVPEIQRMLDFVKHLMRLSYGVRTEDGKRFVKNENQWTEFTQTAVYDEFLYSLFEDPERANKFILGILPGDLRKEATKVQTANVLSGGNDISAQTEVKPEDSGSVITNTFDDQRPAYQQEVREPSNDELDKMNQQEIREAMEWSRTLR